MHFYTICHGLSPWSCDTNRNWMLPTLQFDHVTYHNRVWPVLSASPSPHLRPQASPPNPSFSAFIALNNPSSRQVSPLVVPQTLTAEDTRFTHPSLANITSTCQLESCYSTSHMTCMTPCKSDSFYTHLTVYRHIRPSFVCSLFFLLS